MMAVGLNIVVGYAGLLDLGYVAFYATGAYTAALVRVAAVRRQKCPTPGSASELPGARAEADFNFGAVGIPPAPAASTSRSGSCSCSPASSPRSSGSSSACRRCACAATTSRSSRSASARSCRRSRATATTSAGFNLTNGAERDHAARLARLRQRPLAAGRARSCRRTTSRAARRRCFGHQIQSPTSSSGPRSCCSLVHGLLLAAAAVTRASAARGSRSARTRPRPRRWASR